jgi:hypothetical protein
MRRYVFIVVLAVSVLGFAVVSSAHEHEGMKGPMAGECAKGGNMGMCPKHYMIMKDMMAKKIVATEDGSVVVMAGNKLMKYDKNLDLKKEVELKCDMKEMCDKMRKDCPMCQEMMEKGGMKQGAVPEKAEQPAKKDKK